MIISSQSNPLRSLAASALLCAGLAVALVVELTATREANAPASTATLPSSAAVPKTPGRFTLPPLESFAEVTERPLFSSSRRPTAVDTPQSAERQPLSAILAGIVISGTSSSVIVSHGDPPVLTRLKTGDDLDGWSVTSIEPTGVVLRRNGEEQQLKLRDIPGQTAAEVAPKVEPAPRPRR